MCCKKEGMFVVGMGVTAETKASDLCWVVDTRDGSATLTIKDNLDIYAKSVLASKIKHFYEKVDIDGLQAVMKEYGFKVIDLVETKPQVRQLTLADLYDFS